MHRIIQAHLKSFSENFGYASIEESVQFEKFCAYSVLSSRYSAEFDLDDVTTGEGDDGIDGVAVIIDEAPCPSAEEATEIFKSARRNHDVDLVFVQSKGGETFDLGDFLKFKEGIIRYVTSEIYKCSDDVLSESKATFDVVVSNVPKIRNGQPSVYAYYITTGLYQRPAELEKARLEFQKQLSELGYFHHVDVSIIGRDELTKLWVGTYSGTQASFTALSNAALPEISGINEAYLAVVKAADLVDHLLVTDDGNLRGQVFEENVRAYLGDDNPVNKSISETIRSERLIPFAQALTICSVHA